MGLLDGIINKLLPNPTHDRVDDNDIREALDDHIDTGNAIIDSFMLLNIQCDSFELEKALMLIPEDGRDMEYFIDRWRELYVELAKKEVFG